jgi:hypothetical protein
MDQLLEDVEAVKQDLDLAKATLEEVASCHAFC